MSAHHFVAEVLDEYGRSVRRVLFDYLPRSEPWSYLYSPVADYPLRGGRTFRPAVCLATARAFGATADDALRTAASIEMMHNAMLIHDDIEDESEERRGRPTLHRLEGLPIALNAGDLLAFLSLRPLLENLEPLGAELTLRLLQESEKMARESAEGQALELGWRRDNASDVRESDYLVMVLKKTCWLLSIYPTRAGALIATGGRVELEPFVRFGFFLGAAFQIQDDLLNLVGDAELYGKELGGDLLEGKRTLMLIHLLEHAAPDERAAVQDFLGRPRDARQAEEVARLYGLMEKYGSIDHARRVGHAMAGAALHEITTICRSLPPSRDRRFLEALPSWVLARA